MTETEWLNPDDEYPRQLAVVQDYSSVRKLRLIACVLVRHAQVLPDNEDSKHCDDLIESIADHPRPWDELEDELWRRPGNWRFTHIMASSELTRVVMELRKIVAFNAIVPVPTIIDLIHEVVGNPFRRVSFDLCWRTATTVALAQGMYDSRDFSAMPILADALQDAGCEHADILAHCRDEKQIHVRGCWVVDLVLGKE